MTHEVSNLQATATFVALQLSLGMQHEQSLSCENEWAHMGNMSAYRFHTVGATQPF